ncbi:hypothetical protein FNF27_06582 [Cafeteria roenbergensis]|uniref:Kinetochore protein NDC80 n=1 Tax=Cafeteria roenbergensis TaxID=33653 RepID=A0A5A8E383_CAFRO|nr:hypothetical protein FNF27_06582 [Cafeteria roenbergensis]
MRRTTLGPVHSSAFNSDSRASLGGSKSRMSVGGPTRRGRASMAPTAGGGAAAAASSRRDSMASRRGSVAGPASGRASLYGGGRSAVSRRAADPRPVASREFINEQVNELIMFLAQNNYNQRISHKMFNPPTSKDFKSVVAFLFKLLDEGYEIEGRMEDEVPLVFKALRYPFSISKTGLTAVGSPHTWPALLAALSWLVELLQYDGVVRDAEEDDDDGAAVDGGDERLFFKYLRRSYEAFLSGDDDRHEALDAEISGTFQAKQEEIAAETAEIQDEAARLRAELEALRSQESALPESRSRRADLVSDKGKFEDLIGQLEAHQAALDAKLKQRSDEAEGKEAEAEEARRALEEARHTVDTQELCPEDVERMEAQRAKHRERAAAVARQREQAALELDEADAALGAALERLEAQLEAYTRAAGSLRLLAPDDENAEGVNFELELDMGRLGGDGLADGGASSLAASRVGGGGGAAAGSAAGRRESLSAQLSRLSTADILGTDVRGVIRPALRELKSTLHARTGQAKSAEAELRDATEAAREGAEDLRARRAEATKRVQSLTETYKREKSAVDRSLEGLVARTDDVEAQVEAARKELAEAEEEASRVDERALRRIREAANRRVDEARRQTEQAVAALRADTEAVAAHVDRIRGLLASAATDVEASVQAAISGARARAQHIEDRCREH